jgi:hypothetical protein
MEEGVLKIRRAIAVAVVFAGVVSAIFASADMWQPIVSTPIKAERATGSAAQLLQTIAIKGRAPKTGYARTQYGDGWAVTSGCDTRNIILHRDLQQPAVGEGCKVLSGTLNDPYTGKMIVFKRGADSSADVQIDHVVALSNSWQTGAQLLTKDERQHLANDPLELLAVDGPANQAKGDGDAATWLPPNKLFRCQYVSRQIAVKAKYHLWMTPPEHDAAARILDTCPGQMLPAS